MAKIRRHPHGPIPYPQPELSHSLLVGSQEETAQSDPLVVQSRCCWCPRGKPPCTADTTRPWILRQPDLYHKSTRWRCILRQQTVWHRCRIRRGRNKLQAWLVSFPPTARTRSSPDSSFGSTASRNAATVQDLFMILIICQSFSTTV